tara:strand:- start:1242 stop:1850 length:609 start_codon:yes stop_codon:yes gene_type:complete
VYLFSKINNLLLKVMNNTKIILYDCPHIYKILKEINGSLKLDLVNIDNKKDLEDFTKNNENYLIMQINKEQNKKDQIILNDLPLKLDKIIEKINLAILKKNFATKSNIKIGEYILDFNSREISFQKKKLKLTEQEIKIIIYFEKIKRPVKVDELQKDIWGYSDNLETHTVETHIHRLRKKFENFFNDKDIILSTKQGYQIKI